MSRKIKFRAYSKKYGMSEVFELLYVMNDRSNLIKVSGGYIEINMADEIMQYTGLKAKHGKESFNSDICKDEEGYIFEVVYWQGCFWAKYHDGSRQYVLLKDVIEISEGIPFIDITGWDHKKLYELKGEVVSQGVESITGLKMPVYPKRRFQHGAVSSDTFLKHFPEKEIEYRKEFLSLYE